MDIDCPKGYSPCWLDESPPKDNVQENRRINFDNLVVMIFS